MSVLNIDISKFDNVMNIDSPINFNLLQWLSDDSNKDEILKIRTLSGEAYKAHKKKLSGITPSGIFNRRCEAGLIEHSGLIQFDIDAKDNPGNMGELKKKIKLIPYVAYLSFSTSGKGLWGIIPIKYPDQHKAHFRAIEKAFNKAGITIDRAPSNVASFRFKSYDAEAYFNHNSETFPYLAEEQKKQSSGKDNRTKVEELITKIQHNHIDITDGYETWLKIGFALAEEFRESGRIYFHQVSQWHPEYDTQECDKQFTNCLKSNRNGISIASFFHVCKQYGITLDLVNTYHEGIRDKTAHKEYESQSSAPYGRNPYSGEIFDKRGYPKDWDFHLN